MVPAKKQTIEFLTPKGNFEPRASIYSPRKFCSPKRRVLELCACSPGGAGVYLGLLDHSLVLRVLVGGAGL